MISSPASFRRIRRASSALLGAGLLATAAPAFAEDITLTHADRGAINNPSGILGTVPKVTGGSYQVRYNNSGATTRGYFTFDLGLVNRPVLAARLRIAHASNSYDSSADASETVVLTHVSTPATTLSAIPTTTPSEPDWQIAVQAAFNDLGSEEPNYGQFEGTLSDNGSVEEIALNATAVASLNAVRGTPTRWSVGLDIGTVNGGASERVFRGSATGSAATELIVTIAPPVPLLSRVGQWSAAALLGLAGVVAVRRRSRKAD
jgi:hypothetical protein